MILVRNHNARCVNCPYWAQHAKPPEKEGGEPTPLDLGECRIHAPRLEVVPVNPSEDSVRGGVDSVTAMHPRNRNRPPQQQHAVQQLKVSTAPDYWCGDHPMVLIQVEDGQR